MSNQDVLPYASNAYDSAPLLLVVRLVSGMMLASFKLSPYSTISEVEEETRRISGMEGRARFSFNASVLSPWQTLADVGLQDGSVITAVRLPDLVVAAAFEDGSAAIWNGETVSAEMDCMLGQCQRTLIDIHDNIRTAAFSDTHALLAVGSLDGTIKVWNFENGNFERMLEGHDGGVLAIKFATGGVRFLSGGGDGNLRLWDAASGSLEREFEGHGHPVTSVAICPQGRQVAAGLWNGSVELWDVISGHCLLRNDDESAAVLSIAFSPTEALLAAGTSDGVLRLHNTHNLGCERTISGQGNSVWCVDYSPDGTLLAAGTDSGVARVFSDGGRGNKARGLLTGGEGKWLYSVTFSSDGTLVATGSDDGTVGIWSAEAGWRRKTLRIPLPQQRASGTGAIAVVFPCAESRHQVDSKVSPR